MTREMVTESQNDCYLLARVYFIPEIIGIGAAVGKHYTEKFGI